MDEITRVDGVDKNGGMHYVASRAARARRTNSRSLGYVIAASASPGAIHRGANNASSAPVGAGGMRPDDLSRIRK